MISLSFIHRKQFFLLLAMTLAFGGETTNATNNILLVGDSMAQYMGKRLGAFCPGSNVGNAGWAGSTAEQWSQITPSQIPWCNISSAEGQMLWDIVYISVGGNDILKSNCTIGRSELKSRVEAAIDNIATNVAPGASKYVMTGYCMPTGLSQYPNCNTPSDFAMISDILRDNNLILPNGVTVEIFDSIGRCGGSSTSWSNPKYFIDPIHLNVKGYCRVLKPSHIQSALNCGAFTNPGPFTNPSNCHSWRLDIFKPDRDCEPV